MAGRQHPGQSAPQDGEIRQNPNGRYYRFNAQTSRWHRYNAGGEVPEQETNASNPAQDFNEFARVKNPDMQKLAKGVQAMRSAVDVESPDPDVVNFSFKGGRIIQVTRNEDNTYNLHSYQDKKLDDQMLNVSYQRMEKIVRKVARDKDNEEYYMYRDKQRDVRRAFNKANRSLKNSMPNADGYSRRDGISGFLLGWLDKALSRLGMK